MEKILAPADKVLSEIGRFVLIRPIVSTVLLLTAIIITLLSNNILNSSTSEYSLQEVTIPYIATGSSRLLAEAQPSLLHSQVTLANHPPVILNAPLPSMPITSSVKSGSQISATTNFLPNYSNSTPRIQHLPLPVATPAAISTTPVIPTNVTWQAFRIRKGDNLAGVFRKYKISAKDAVVLAALPSAKPLRHLKAGKEMLLIIDDKHKLQKLTYAAGEKDTLALIRTASAFQLEKVVAKPTMANTASVTQNPGAIHVLASSTAEITKGAASLVYASGEVHKSLAVDARKAGLSAKGVNELAQIFNGQKVQRGDQFSVISEEGPTVNKANANNVLIAQLTHAGKLSEMIRFTDPAGNTNYYTPSGESHSAGILRAPVQYKRISSGFSQSRFHPLLHFFRPHLGVDYAAPTGTPIKAAGNGVIAEIERAGGYGNSIIIKHDTRYSTLYAHMSHFASNLHVGSAVQQGQVIGYVGSTGLATGPHLHYEIHVNNIAMNPLTVNLPPQSIPSSYRNQFLSLARALMTRLKLDQSVRLADKGDPIKRS